MSVKSQSNNRRIRERLESLMVSDQLRNSDEDSRSKQASTLKYNEFVKILGSENHHDLEALKKISEVTRPSKTPN